MRCKWAVGIGALALVALAAAGLRSDTTPSDPFRDARRALEDMRRGYDGNLEKVDMEEMRRLTEEARTKALDFIADGSAARFYEAPAADNGGVAGPGGFMQDNALARPERVFVLISSSVPRATLRSYGQALETVPGEVVLAMRGFVGGAGRLEGTVKFVRETLVGDDRRTEPLPYGIVIDPRYFRKYGVTRVPAVVFDTGADDIALDEWTREKPYYVYYGDTSLDHALTEINKGAKSQYLAGLIARMRGSGGFFGR